MTTPKFLIDRDEVLRLLREYRWTMDNFENIDYAILQIPTESQQ